MKNKHIAPLIKQIREIHKQMDEMFETCSDIEKAFILGTYVWKLEEKKEK